MSHSQEMNLPADPGPDPMNGRKPLVLFVLTILFVIASGMGVTLYLYEKIAGHHETIFQEQQALQVSLARQAVEKHIQWLLKETGILGTHSLPEFVRGKRDLSSLDDLFRHEQTAYPEHLVHAFLDRPDHLVHIRHLRGTCGIAAMDLALGYASQHWKAFENPAQGPLIPALHITPDLQAMGILLPVRKGHTLKGVLSVVVDLAPMILQYIAPIRFRQHGAAYLVDNRGMVIYDHEQEIIGRNIFDGLHDQYPALLRVDRRMMAETSGTDSYQFLLQRGQGVTRKLIAWDKVKLGDHALIVALSAPDTYIKEALWGIHVLQIVSGILLLTILIASGTAFFRLRQQLLVEKATRENQKKYRTVFNASFDAIALINARTGKFVDGNSAAVTFAGVASLDELIGRTPTDFAPDCQPGGTGSVELIAAQIRTAFDTGGSVFEWLHQKKRPNPDSLPGHPEPHGPGPGAVCADRGQGYLRTQGS